MGPITEIGPDEESEGSIMSTTWGHEPAKSAVLSPLKTARGPSLSKGGANFFTSLHSMDSCKHKSPVLFIVSSI